MFPTLSYFIEYLTGINIPLPIQTFGFMMALSFIAAAYTLRLELKRKEQNGLIKTTSRKIIIGKPASIFELIFTFITGFIIGYKLLEMFLHYRELTDDPQTFILSSRGNIIGGLMLGAGLVYMKYAEKKKEQLPEPKEEIILVQAHEQVWDITIVAAVSGLIGAKVFDNLENWNDLIADPIGAIFSFSGLTFYGGLIFGFIAVLWYTHKLSVKPLDMMDAAAPGLILAYAVGRGGCQLSGDGDWGIANSHAKPGVIGFLPDWMWKFTYPHNVIGAGVPITGCEGKFCFQLPEAVYPTSFYEIIMASLIFIFLWSIRKRINISGKLFCVYLILNGIERFTIELIRVNPRYNIFGLHPSQAEIIAVCLILIGVSGLLFLKKKTPMPANEIPMTENDRVISPPQG